MANEVRLHGGPHHGRSVKVKGYPDHIKIADYDIMPPPESPYEQKIAQSTCNLSNYIRKDFIHPNGNKCFQYVFQCQEGKL